MCECYKGGIAVMDVIWPQFCVNMIGERKLGQDAFFFDVKYAYAEVAKHMMIRLHL